MSDRRSSQYHYPTQWNNGGQHYPSSSNYSASPYQHGAHDVDLPHQMQPAYGGMQVPQNDAPYQGGYYSNPLYSPSSPPSQSNMYPMSSQGMRTQQPSERTGHYHSHSHSTSHTHGTSPYSQVPQQPQSHYTQTRPRSHSQAPSYAPAPTMPIAIPQQSPSHFHSTPQSISISPQYSATPSRPFTCDLCALSFNRQHDLKRHRETHTGEKPYLCNGGCGKTFTRKDALKRHQLVKACGKVDDA